MNRTNKRRQLGFIFFFFYFETGYQPTVAISPTFTYNDFSLRFKFQLLTFQDPTASTLFLRLRQGTRHWAGEMEGGGWEGDGTAGGEEWKGRIGGRRYV